MASMPWKVFKHCLCNCSKSLQLPVYRLRCTGVLPSQKGFSQKTTTRVGDSNFDLPKLTEKDKSA